LGPRVVDVRDQGQLGKPLSSKRLERPDRSIHQKAATMHVFEQGLVLGDESGAVAEGFRWEEVDEFTKKVVEQIFQGPTQVNRHKAKWTEYSFTFKVADRQILLTGRTDEKGTLSALKGGARPSVFEGFSDLVSPLVCAAQLPRLLGALHNGETLRFGQLGVSLEGLTKPAFRKKARQTGWQDLTSYGVRGGELVIDARTSFTTWYEDPVGRVPNLDALLEIMRIVLAAL
jgi:hypothetical protein